MNRKSVPLILFAALSFSSPTVVASAASSSLSESDWAGIRAARESWRHRFEKTEDGTFTAHNPGQNWTTRFDGRGFLIEPSGQSWSWGLQLSDYGIGTPRNTLSGKARVEASGKRLSYQWDDTLEEWFLNDSRGVEQGWTFTHRPAGATNQTLQLGFTVRGGLTASVHPDGLTVAFSDQTSTTALSYGGLRAWDADGRKLPVRFIESTDANRLTIEVDDRNATYPVTIDPVAQQARLKADNAENFDAFGWSVAISGDTVAVTARYEGGFENNFPSSGAVYIFVREGNSWSQQAYIRAFNAGADDYFGTSVALSGDTLVVGATGEDGTAAGDAFNNGSPNAGAAYVYTRSGSTWTIQSRLKAPNAGEGDMFGSAVAVSDGFVFVGAPSEDSSNTSIAMNNDDAFNPGAVYVFAPSGMTWSLHSYLKSSTTNDGDQFGTTLAVSGNTLVAGAVYDGGLKGSCAVFTYDGSNWTEQAVLQGSNSQLNDSFGTAVAISGDTIVVGANYEDSGLDGMIDSVDEDIGAAYVYVRNAGVWTEQAILKASNAGYKDEFGGSVAISGDLIAVGARMEDSDLNGTESDFSNYGAVYLFQRNGTNWTQKSLLKGGSSAIGAFFGTSVAFDGNTIIVGASGEDTGSGAAYTFTTVPEIAVEQPAGTDLTDAAASVDLGSSVVGTAAPAKTFTIRNTGLADLAGLSVSKTGSHAANFSVGALGATSLAPGASTTFTVIFTPSGTGARTAALQIASDDADENPFDITLTGTGLAVTAPDIAVEQPSGTNLVDGSATISFGNANVGASNAKTFTIRNSGTANLTGLALTRSGTHASDFTLGTLGATSLLPGASTTFAVTFTPSASGTRTAALQIASNDANENPFNIVLGGSGVAVATAPEIVVEQPAGTNLADGSATISFGNANVGASNTRTFTIRNPGTANLTGLALTRSGTHASNFTLGTLGATSLTPGASTTFTVTFTPSASGTRTAALQIASNDANENPFNVSFTGMGVAVVPTAPEIVVEQPVGSNLEDGTASLGFDTLNIGKSTTKTVTLRNTGAASLNGIALTVSGTHASDFRAEALAATTLAPGASTTFTVTFTPGATGSRAAALHIVSNDADESPFDISLSGIGAIAAKPEIVVKQGKGAKANLKDNRSTRDFGTTKPGEASKPMVFTIRNTGDSKLTRLRVSFKGRQAADFKLVRKPAKFVAPGGRTRFKVIYKPLAERSSRTTLRIANNDADENPFRVKLTGKGQP